MNSKKLNTAKGTLITSWRLFALLWSIDKKLISFNAIAVIVPALVPFIFAYLFKLIIDQIILIISGATTDYSLLIITFIASFLVYIVQSISFSAQDYANRLLYTKLPISLYNIVLTKISSLDMAYFENSEFKNTLEKVKDAYTWRPLNMMNNLLFTLQSLIQVITAMLVLIYLAPILILPVTIVAIPELLSRIRESQLSWGVWDAQSKDRKRFWYTADLLQSRDSVKEMKLFQLPTKFLFELKSLQQNLYKENKRMANKYFLIHILLNFFSGVTFIGVLLYIVLEALAKRITVGGISYYTTVITNLQNGIGGLLRNGVQLFIESLYVSSIFEVLDAPAKVIAPQNPVKVDLKNPPLIEFKNVSFLYPQSERYALKDFNLVVNPGEKIALVGENGSGKTTIIKLLCRFYDVSEGEILINGVNIKNVSLDDWYKAIGVIFQDFVKYEYKVSENIYFGKTHEKENLEEIIKAANLAGADPMIKKLKYGYDQMLGRTFEEGIELSTGQWQKIALARGFFRNAPILILDEPTAAIDARAEAEIFNRVEKLSEDKTVVIISHRFSTVRNADKIFVIDDGKIIESGSHEQLMKKDGHYASLFNLQARGYK